jgi:mono/diheme cytochrome c family protein
VQQVRTRFSFLVMALLVSVIAVACGRASPDDIDNALGITSTATLSEADVAQLTAQAEADQQTREAAQAALASPGAGGGGGDIDLASAGNPVQGRTAFLQRCQSCHRPGGAGPAPELAGPGNPATNYSDQELVDLLRTGEGHATPPGPLNEVAVNEAQMINILAFIREQSE